jgi:hypothetical protein
MRDPDTFLLHLYVSVDSFCKAALPPEPRMGPGPMVALSRSAVVTLGIFGQWGEFPSERAFYRYARRHLRGAFPALPHRTQCNRRLRRYQDAIVAFALQMADALGAARAPYEALDTSGVPTRNSKRRGAGWLANQAAIGWSNRVGWYEGLHLLTSVTPDGVITSFAIAPGTAKDQPMAETFFALRAQGDPRLPSVGHPADGPYLVDTGFEGTTRRVSWRAASGAVVIGPPKHRSGTPWPKPLRRWLAGLRQIVETVYDKLHYTFRLLRERPHEMSGLRARLAAKVALHHFCIWLTVQLGRPRLAFADLVDW